MTRRTRQQRMGYCGACARPVHRGEYLLCSKGCGARLCRGHGRCTAAHNPQCPNNTRDFTDSPQTAA
ncbi:hypothetical protein ACFU98_47350 [Streptomyces sp. NPDC057575]|uniref:hypothetical protein n=1 Tax=unclassified Streptomyces TaxID=2593676 RepID=UPI0036CC3829